MADMETVGEGARRAAEHAGAWVDTTPYTVENTTNLLSP